MSQKKKKENQKAWKTFFWEIFKYFNQFCSRQKDSNQCLMKIGQRDCWEESYKHKLCISKYNNKILCLPEENKFVSCINKKAINIVLNTSNIK